MIGGSEVAPGDKTWMVRIEQFGELIGSWSGNCSGELIAPTFVLTAGHCAEGVDTAVGKQQLRVRFVTAGGSSTILVKRSAVWGDFSMNSWGFNPGMVDVGLLELAEPAPAGIDPIALASPADAQRLDDLSVIGFGPRELSDADMHDRPSIGPVRFASPSACRTNGFGITRREICAVSADPALGTSPCPGDSGGALLSALPDPAVIALTSWSAGKDVNGNCGLPAGKRFGVFARLDGAETWLRRQTGEPLFGLAPLAQDTRSPRLRPIGAPRVVGCRHRRGCRRFLRVRVAATDSTGTGVRARINAGLMYARRNTVGGWDSSRLVSLPASGRSTVVSFRLPGRLFGPDSLMIGINVDGRAVNGLGNGSPVVDL